MLDTVRAPSVALAMITPSGNLVVERVTTALLAAFPHVSAHYTRISVTGSSDRYPTAYDWPTMLQASQLLADAAPASICWNGSRGASFGFGVDHELCERITGATGLPATTATLAIDVALREFGCRRIALVTPYRPLYVAKLMAGFAAAGYTVVAEAHADFDDNLAYASIPDDDIVGMARSVGGTGVDAVVTFCTNLPAAHLIDRLEQQIGLPVFDSTSAAVWAALRLAGQGTAPGRAWGSLFGRDAALSAFAAQVAAPVP